MSNTMRWRYGDTKPVMASVPEGVEIEVGDLVYLSGYDVLPASEGFWKGNFLGVSMQRSRSMDTMKIRVATTGVFQYTCDPDSFTLGELVAPKIDGMVVSSQVVEKNNHSAIGRVAQMVKGKSNIVFVEIHSDVMSGPINRL